ncbi:DUF2461 domain-containing protein [Lentilitoribacter sp. EG35]|uniref:DUF2461 domain-containing protein n=1 Tax=Lentilitoribacter sp. EG35 TaxID=3234192 RepID=UPI003460042B
MSTGFTKETFDFLTELKVNNTKEWFERNKARYEEHWVAAAVGFINAVSPMMEGLDPMHKTKAKINGSLRRIYRDVRFSKDKSPYDARLHMVFWTGDHPQRSPALHIVLHPDHVGYGAGEWGMSPEKLLICRNALRDPSRVEALNAAINQAGDVGCELNKEDLKRMPKGFEDVTGETAMSLLKRKALVVRNMDKGISVDDFIGPDGMEKVQKVSQKLAPFNKWLCNLD